MAFTLRDFNKVTFNIVTLDQNEVPRFRSKTVEFEITGATESDQLLSLMTNAELWITDFEAVSYGRVTDYHISPHFVNNTQPTPISGDIFHEALLTVSTSNSLTKTATLAIPAPIDDIIDTNGYVARSNAEVLAFLANYQFSTGKARVSDGEYVNDDDPFRATGQRDVASRSKYS